MGLTIHYRLRTDETSVESVRALVGSFHALAKQLPFQEVEGIVEFRDRECGYDNQDDPNRWLKIQAGQYVEVGGNHFKVMPLHIIAFTAVPGEGSEPANIGLCRYPEFVHLEQPRRQHDRPTAKSDSGVARQRRQLNPRAHANAQFPRTGRSLCCQCNRFADRNTGLPIEASRLEPCVRGRQPVVVHPQVPARARKDLIASITRSRSDPWYERDSTNHPERRSAMVNILGSLALAYLAGSGVVTNSNVVGRGLFRSLRHIVDGNYRDAGVEAIAGLSAPALMSYATTCALVMDVVDGAYELADPALTEPEIRQMPPRRAA